MIAGNDNGNRIEEKKSGDFKSVPAIKAGRDSYVDYAQKTSDFPAQTE